MLRVLTIHCEKRTNLMFITRNTCKHWSLTYLRSNRSFLL